MDSRIYYTLTDEAPALATYSLLPIFKKFAKEAGIAIETKDISLAGRILSVFPEALEEDQRVSNALEELGELTQMEETNIIKLPNISASMPQLTSAIKELQNKGYRIPDYPEKPKDENEKLIKEKYDKVKGSAVNPVLREGNSDRRAPNAVKEFAKKNPHRMGDWSSGSKTHVATMSANDFYHNEQSVTMEESNVLHIELVKKDGSRSLLKSDISVLKGEIIDASFMSKKALVNFLEAELADAKESGILFSAHLKATMMKVSDPIIFGHVLEVYFKDVFKKYGEELLNINANSRDGLGKISAVVESLPENKKQEILNAFREAMENGPDLAMVDSDKGITNLHVPSDVIIDASMPAMIRNSGQMWDKDGVARDTKAVIPESSYAGIYEATIEFCKKNGAFNPSEMGTVPNVGLMAQKAEEYGSHDKTFEISHSGTVYVVNDQGEVLLKHEVEEGDIWRMCQVKDAPIKNWVGLAVERARATNWPAVFWLDEKRAHDFQLIKKVKKYLKESDLEGLKIEIMPPKEACLYTLSRVKEGENTISVTGNVLRDYLTDLFPILELGTSAKMLSIVPLMKGGGLFETGAGGSAPKHVQQLLEENHLRWDSLGEFLAFAVSLEHLAKKKKNLKATILADCLDKATETLLMNGNSPSRKVNELDNRGSHFYLALYWAEALAEQEEDESMKLTFTKLAQELRKNEREIVNELNAVQGKSIELGGYYYPDKSLVEATMRPSETLNQIIE